MVARVKADGKIRLDRELAGGAECTVDRLKAAAPNAVCESTAIHFQDVPMPLMSMHFSGVRFRSSYASTRIHMPEVIAALEAGQIDPRISESEVVSLEDAPRRLAEPSWRPVLIF